MNPDFRALCAELVKLVERCPVTSDIDWICDRNELIVRFHNACRAALAQPAPEHDPIAEFMASCKPLPDETMELLTPEARWRLYEGSGLQPAPEPPAGEGPSAAELARLIAELREPNDSLPQYRTINSSYADRIAYILASHVRPDPAPAPEPLTLDGVFDLCEDHGFELSNPEEESAGILLEMFREALARWGQTQPAPVKQGPTYSELSALRDELDTCGAGEIDLVDFARAVLARWGQGND